MPRVIHSVSISPELSEQIKKKNIRPSDAFKRGVMLYIRDSELSNDDNPLQLKEKIVKITQRLNEKCEEYELLKAQYDRIINEKNMRCE